MAKQLKDNVWIRLPKQVTFQFLTKCRRYSQLLMTFAVCNPNCCQRDDCRFSHHEGLLL